MPIVRCKRCNRRLKTPESILVGFGSSCYRRCFGKSLKDKRSKKKTNIEAEEYIIDGQVSFFD